VGRILDALEKTGKSDNTVVVFLGDHGPSFPRGKMTAYEGGVRVPLLMRWPGHMEKGRRVGELVSTLDLMPTLVAAAGAEAPADLPGRSLLPLARGEKCPWREHLFTEFTLHWPETYFPQRTVRDRRYKLIHNLLPGRENPVFGWCHLWQLKIFRPEAVDDLPAPWKEVYRRFRRPPEFELYDLQEDPWETRNLAGDKAHADTLERLKKVLAAWQERTGDALRKPELLKRFTEESDATLTGAKGIIRGRYRRKRDWQYVKYLYER
jgi:N-sulfoglucosamine sulfohydrolase